MKQRILASMKKGVYFGFALALVLVLPSVAVSQAAVQTLTIFGANGTAGEIHPYTEYFNRATGTWQPAFVATFREHGQNHPWGFVPGTNGWLNYRVDGASDPQCNLPSPASIMPFNPEGACWYTYRVRFSAPSDWTNPTLSFEIKADNFAKVELNGTPLHSGLIEGQPAPLNADFAFESALQPGINTITIYVGDWGGLNGFNFRIDMSVVSDEPLGLVSAVDTTPPVIVPEVSGTPGENGWYVSDVTVSWAVTDAESPISSTSGCGASTVTSDTTGTTFTCEATSAGGTASNSVTIKRDATAPEMACSVTPSALWPPNHKMVDVNASVAVSDATSGTAGFKLAAALSNEPDNGLGDGDTPNDIQGFVLGTPSTAGQVRAERSGKGSGRVYTLSYTGMDQAGNSASCSPTVSVAHDRRK